MEPLIPQTTDVVILCGGRGARLGDMTAHRPKPLLPVGGRPFLLRVLGRMKEEGFTRIILAVHYLAEQFRAFVSTCQELGLQVELVIEPKPLGTGGALRHAVQHIRSSTFVAMNGDSWIAQPIGPVLAEHARSQRVCTVVAVPAAQIEGQVLAKGRWHVGADGEMLGFSTPGTIEEGWINAGLYVFSRELVLSWPNGAYSLEANFERLLSRADAKVFRSTGWLLDIGTPECYENAQRLLTSDGLPAPVLSLRSSEC